jgi:tetratricopeptide (TPR) repeat protein
MQPARLLLLITLLFVLGSVAVTIFIDSRESSAASAILATDGTFAEESAQRGADAVNEATNLITKRLLLFMAGGIAAAILLLSFGVPIVSDMIAAYFYVPAEEIEPDASELAAAKVSQGDYEGAIEEYHKLMDQNPSDRFPVIEIARLYHEKLDMPEAAINFLEESLNDKEWEVDDAAFLMFRMVAIELEDRNDPVRARELLQLIAENFEGTRHAANASHRIDELDSGAWTPSE